MFSFHQRHHQLRRHNGSVATRSFTDLSATNSLIVDTTAPAGREIIMKAIATYYYRRSLLTEIQCIDIRVCRHQEMRWPFRRAACGKAVGLGSFRYRPDMLSL